MAENLKAFLPELVLGEKVWIGFPLRSYLNSSVMVGWTVPLVADITSSLICFSLRSSRVSKLSFF